MAEYSRKSDVACPVCGAMLHKPVPSDGNYDWDCFKCCLEIPGSRTVSGIDLINFAKKQTDPIAFLRSIADIDFHVQGLE